MPPNKLNLTAKPNKPKTNKISKAKALKEFVMVNNQIYYVQTQTDRVKLSNFQNLAIGRVVNKDKKTKEAKKVKIQLESRPKVVRERTVIEQISLLSVHNKKQIMYELRKEIQKKEAQPALTYLDKELNRIEVIILNKKQANLDLLQLLIKSQKISQEDYEEKKDILEKIVERKLKLIDNIKYLFKSLLTNEKKLDETAEINLSQLIYSANSMSCISEDKIVSEKSLEESKHEIISQLQQNLKIKQNELEISDFSKLDINRSLDSINQIGSIEEIKSEGQISESSAEFIQQHTKPKKQLFIPPIMTKDRRQQLQKQKLHTLQRRTEAEIEKRLGVQLGCIQKQSLEGIQTHLGAISAYVTSLTGFLTTHYLQEVLELINIPYGKSVQERLSQLNGNPIAQDHLPYILNDKLFIQFEESKGFNKYEQIHHKIIFDCLNSSLNIYRPYYSFNGEIYPWLTTYKGMTFYSISEQNIQQVFEKSKIKILETAAVMCGVLLEESFDKQTLETKRQQFLKRAINAEIQQTQEQWQAYQYQEASVRMQISKQIYLKLIQQLADQCKHFI